MNNNLRLTIKFEVWILMHLRFFWTLQLLSPNWLVNNAGRLDVRSTDRLIDWSTGQQAERLASQQNKNLVFVISICYMFNNHLATVKNSVSTKYIQFDLTNINHFIYQFVSCFETIYFRTVNLFILQAPTKNLNIYFNLRFKLELTWTLTLIQTLNPYFEP